MSSVSRSDFLLRAMPARHPWRLSLLHAAVAGALAAAGLAVSPPVAAASAQPAASSFSIPAGDLESALQRFAAQTGALLTYTPDLVAGRRTQGLAGAHDTSSALAELLRGTGLEASLQPSGSYLLRQVQMAASDVSTLEAVDVQAMIGPVTEGTGSYTTPLATSATRLSLPLRHTPQSISVVTRQRMDDQKLENVTEVLKYATGVNVAEVESNRQLFTARGFTLTNFQYDGVPAPFDEIYQWGDGVNDLAFYDRVEIVRGSTGLVNGAGEPSATVNLVRKRPKKEFAFSGGFLAGSWDRYRAEADLSVPLVEDGRIRARLVGVYDESKTFFDIYEQKKHLFYGVVEADLTDSTLLKLGFDYQSIRPRGVTWGGIPGIVGNIFDASSLREANLPRNSTVAADWTKYNTDVQTVFASVEHKLNDDWKVRLAYDHRENKLDSASLVLTMGIMDPGGSMLFGGSSSRYQGKRKQDSIDLYTQGKVNLFGRNHEIIAGINAFQTDVDIMYGPGGGFTVPNYWDWDGSYVPEPAWQAWRKSTDLKTSQMGAFAAMRLSLTDRLMAVLGARYGSHELEQLPLTPTAEAKRYRYSGELTPYAGAIYDLDEDTSAFISYTEIFKPQTQRGVDERLIDPITGNNWEAGIKREFWEGRANFSVSYYHLKQDNVARLLSPLYRLPDGTYAYRGVPGARSRGVDIEFSGELAKGWNLFAGFNYNETKSSTDNWLDKDVPKGSLKLFTTYRLPGSLRGLTVGGGATWHSSVYGSSMIGNSLKEDPVTVVDLMARYEFNRNLSATLNINNVFDRNYYSGFWENATVYYGRPRSFLLSVQYKY